MLDIKWIRENPNQLDQGLAKRGLLPQSHEMAALDEKWRASQTQIQELQSERNTIAQKVAEAKRAGDNTDALAARATELKRILPDLEEEASLIQKQLDYVLSVTPNMPRPEVPEGKSEEDNKVIKHVGVPKTFAFEPKRHFELGEDLGLMDFETSAKMSGSRFVLLRGALARLERALANFMLDIHTKEFGYEEIEPPLLVKDEAFYGVGLLPKFADNAFQTTEKLWLIPTAEVSLTNIVADQIIDPKRLPLRFVAHTPCFRSEAGGSGKRYTGYDSSSPVL